jgi:flagellar protein FliS
MPNPHDKYRSQITTGWTRIDMLLALYQRLLSVLDDGIDSGELDRMKAQRMVLALISGLDDTVGEPVTSIQRLLSFVLKQVQSNTPQEWPQARRILATLHAGYEQIAPECRMLERNGQVPPVERMTAAS